MLENFQKDLENKEITIWLQKKEIELQTQYQIVLRNEEETWRLNLRSLWLKAGDKNTKFFHNQAKAQQSRNNVASITLENGTTMTDFEGKAVAKVHFVDLYSQSEEANPYNVDFMLEHIPFIVTNEDNLNRTQPISKPEIFVAIWSLGQDKALGPDGFSISFYQHFWELIKYDCKCMLHYTHQSLRIGGNNNSSFLALIPKEANPTYFSRFWPIYLCNYSYKILTKIMVNRLKIILPKIISPNQGGFMQERQIMDNIVLVQEVIHTSFKTKGKGMVIKLDMANAFDGVKHDFLF